MKPYLICGLVNFDNGVIIYVKYKQRESALRVFLTESSITSLRNVNQTTKYIAKVILDSHKY